MVCSKCNERVVITRPKCWKKLWDNDTISVWERYNSTVEMCSCRKVETRVAEYSVKQLPIGKSVKLVNLDGAVGIYTVTKEQLSANSGDFPEDLAIKVEDYNGY